MTGQMPHSEKPLSYFQGRTALLEAASSRRESLDVVKLLLAHGAGVNAIDGNVSGQTACLLMGIEKACET